MKLRLAGTLNRLNVEHLTSNIERGILMTLRFIDYKISEPNNAELQPATSPSVVSSGSNDSWLKNPGSSDLLETILNG